MMKKSFKTCRTSNAPDYSEDDNICTDDMPKLADDEMAWDDKFKTDNKKRGINTSSLKLSLNKTAALGVTT